MAKAQDEDVAVDQYGRPLPVVELVTKAGVKVLVHDAASLSNLHYAGMEFADDKMTYAKALACLMGEPGKQVMVEVPTEGGDFEWPQPELFTPEADDEADDGGRKSASKKSAKSD